MTITAKEIARQLNLSTATVSMVLNNRPGISESTRKKVLAIAQEYGYIPVSKKNDSQVPEYIIHFIIYKKHGTVVTDTPFFNELMEGIVHACKEANCFPQISYHYGNEGFQLQCERNKYRESSGIILLGTEMNPEDTCDFFKLNLPTVILDSYFEDITADYVLINNVQGAFLATKYLIEKGHRKIGYLKSNIYISNFYERANGYYNALRHFNIPTSHTYVIEVTPQAESCYKDMLEYLSKGNEIATAYFADNDIIAAAAIRAFINQGYRIPEDISIIGFDDMPFCQLTIPPLSTMKVPKKELGSVAVSRLLEKIQQKTSSYRKISIATELTDRSSIFTICK